MYSSLCTCKKTLKQTNHNILRNFCSYLLHFSCVNNRNMCIQLSLQFEVFIACVRVLCKTAITVAQLFKVKHSSAQFPLPFFRMQIQWSTCPVVRFKESKQLFIYFLFSGRKCLIVAYKQNLQVKHDFSCSFI